MHRPRVSLFVTLLVLGLLLLTSALGGAAPVAPTAGDDGPAGTINAGVPAAPIAPPEDVLWDNGPLVNSPGTGPGGADESIARDVTVGLSSRGFNASLAGGFRIADDFDVTNPAGWNVDSVTFYVYQGNSPTSPSPITGVNYQIWDGPPDDPLSMVVVGDTTTNRLTSTTWANMYRRLESQPTDSTRPVMVAVTSAGFFLPAGSYWIDFQVDGDINYTGPWQPPVTIDGQTSTGNGLQSVAGAWQPIVDTALQTPLGVPFVIQGTGGQPTAVALSEFSTTTGTNTVVLLLAGLAALAAAAVVVRRRAL